jgi:hypothetical protein
MKEPHWLTREECLALHEFMPVLDTFWVRDF